MADEFESKAFLQGSSGSSEESLNSFLDEQVWTLESVMCMTLDLLFCDCTRNFN